MNPASSHPRFRRVASLIRSASSMLELSPPGRAAETATKNVPKSARAIPTEQMRMYFHVASSERW